MPRRLPEGIVSKTMTVTTETGLQTATASPSPMTVGINDCTTALSVRAAGATSSETGDVRSAILLAMATKADFTEQEWKTMQEGIAGAGLYVALVDRGFFDSFKEANALAHHLRDAHEHNESVLVRDLATGHEKPFGATSSPDEVEQSVVSTIKQAVSLLEAKSPEDLPAYKQLVLEVSQSVAEAAKGVSDQENQAIEHIRAALGNG
jgi:hypothetical protein